MYFTNTKLARSTAGVALLVAILLSTPAFAADSNEATLTNNERAAQSAIGYTPISGGDVLFESADATLAYNEDAAQHAITNGPADSQLANFRIGPVSGTAGEATLTHNEISAQHAIVDVQASGTFSDVHRSSMAVSSSSSDDSAAPR